MKNKDILVYWFIPVFCVFLFHSCNSSDQNQEEQVSVPADPAISNITQKIKESPDDPSLYIARASILFEKEGYDQAITDLNQAIALDSLSIEAHHLLADVYLKYFRSNNAIKTLEKIVELQPDDQASLLKLAQFQLFLKQNESAIQSLNKTLQLNPQNPEAFFLLGQCFKEMGDTSRAINSFQQAVELDPEIIDGWINLGQLNAALGNKIAAQYFESGLAVAPDNLNLMHAKAFYLADQEKLEEAIEV
ncbi:MAG: tetratricopeptide repeat protein, partial [Bacteroidota bacterium]